MDPIVLIHGYSAESKETTLSAVSGIYGSLPGELRRRYGAAGVTEIDVSRYVSLDDGVTLDDISAALDRALRDEFAHLLAGKFNVIIHSTGALVIRNWIRRHFPDSPPPVRSIIHLAGANLGSGWAHVGKTLVVKWLKMIFQEGAERGVQVLDGLELGSNWTLDLHLSFLAADGSVRPGYDVNEYVIVGSQTPAAWQIIPVRYGKEDGSDGVVRVAASNLNFNYISIGPTDAARAMSYDEAAALSDRSFSQGPSDDRLRAAPKPPTMSETPYVVRRQSRPGVERPEIPFAIPHSCAHSGDAVGVVYGSKTRGDVLPLIDKALNAANASEVLADFDAVTERTYRRVLDSRVTKLPFLPNPKAQYDRHAQLIVRIRDQYGRPVGDSSIYFNSLGGSREPDELINRLFEDHHGNDRTPGVHTFYLRTDAYNAKTRAFEPRIPQIRGCRLEVDAAEGHSANLVYLPLQLDISTGQLVEWVQPHRTTIVDIELLRIAAARVFTIHRLP